MVVIVMGTPLTILYHIGPGNLPRFVTTFHSLAYTYPYKECYLVAD